MLLQCPNCCACWCMEEIYWQQCYCCGYPQIDDDGNYFGDGTDEYFDYRCVDDDAETNNT